MRFLLVISYLLFSQSVTLRSQELPDKTKRIVIDSMYTYVFHVGEKSDSFEVNYKKNRKYYWYDYTRIVFNFYDSNGLILNGMYSKNKIDGRLIEKGFFAYGLKTGVWKHWFDDGRLKKVISWKKGMRWGRYKFFSKSGELFISGSYKRNKKNGVWKTFSDIVIEETWSQDKLNGLYRETLGGNVIVKGYYKDGLKHGVWTDFKSKKKKKYENGKLIPYDGKGFWSKLFKKNKKKKGKS